jgi:hypothetical protein
MNTRLAATIPPITPYELLVLWGTYDSLGGGAAGEAGERLVAGFLYLAADWGTEVGVGSSSNGLTFQMLLLYSWIARSEENLPIRAAL